MPFYEYQCSSCGHETEALQKISDAPLKKCPHCGKSALKRLISAPVFRLKGSGWYETDFKSDQDKKRNLAGQDEAPPAKDADAKPADKADAKETKDQPVAAESSAAKPAAAGSKKLAGKTKGAKPARPARPTRTAVKKPAAKKKAARR